MSSDWRSECTQTQERRTCKLHTERVQGLQQLQEWSHQLLAAATTISPQITTIQYKAFYNESSKHIPQWSNFSGEVRLRYMQTGWSIPQILICRSPGCVRHALDWNFRGNWVAEGSSRSFSIISNQQQTLKRWSHKNPGGLLKVYFHETNAKLSKELLHWFMKVRFSGNFSPAVGHVEGYFHKSKNHVFHLLPNHHTRYQSPSENLANMQITVLV